MAQLGEFSRFRNTKPTIIDGKETYGAWNKQSWLRILPNSNDIGIFRVTNQFEGRPDRISNEIYGTPLLAWVLISFNAIHFNDKSARTLFGWPRAGSVIRYPVESIVLPEVI